MFETLLTPEAMMSYLAFAAFCLLPLCMIFKRAGFSFLFGFFVLAPYAGFFICLGYLGLKRWPREPEAHKK